MNIWFATNNRHKKVELEAILGITLKIPSEHGIPFNPAETETTFNGNALIKARALKGLLQNKDDIVIADDSGICVDALNGAPGVFSAIYGEKDGIIPTSQQQYLLLLDELADTTNRSARFICSMVLLRDENRFIIVQETTEGQIVKKDEVRGTGGFGYDPIFFLPEFNRTLAELSAEEKNRISHRGKAGRLIREIINKK